MGYDMYFRGKDFGDRDRDEFYFRLNIGGMRVFRNYMMELGMTFDGYDGPPEPDWDDETAVEAWRSWHGPEIPGIPVHKLCSNDGWLVLPAECAAAYQIGKDQPPLEHHEDYWREWLDYLHRAAAADGFEVH